MHGEIVDTKRRTLLRGILGVGCAVTVPTLIGGCDQKEAPSGQAGPGGPAETASRGAPPDPSPPPASSTTQPAGKLTKAQVKYQEQPNGDQRCANCLQFLAESNTCKVVDGPISPQGWCNVWVKKA